MGPSLGTGNLLSSVIGRITRQNHDLRNPRQDCYIQKVSPLLPKHPAGPHRQQQTPSPFGEHAMVAADSSQVDGTTQALLNSPAAYHRPTASRLRAAHDFDGPEQAVVGEAERRGHPVQAVEEAGELRVGRNFQRLTGVLPVAVHRRKHLIARRIVLVEIAVAVDAAATRALRGAAAHRYRLGETGIRTPPVRDGAGEQEAFQARPRVESLPAPGSSPVRERVHSWCIKPRNERRF